MDYQFNLRTVYPYLGQIWHAIFTTLLLSVLTIVISLVIGMVVAIVNKGPHRVARILGFTYVEIMRNTPLIVVLYLIYFSAPLIGVRLSSFATALIGLSLQSGGYMAEIFRAGLLSIPHGQYEAAYSQGFTLLQSLRRIVLPQVFRTVYAPFGNQIITVVLATSIASVVGVDEITSWMQTTGSTSFRFFETFLIAAVVYVALVQIINAVRVQMGRYFFQWRTVST